MRTPPEIAADARKKIDAANTAYVPQNVFDLVLMTVEFMESVSSTLIAAGLAEAPKSDGG